MYKLKPIAVFQGQSTRQTTHNVTVALPQQLNKQQIKIITNGDMLTNLQTKYRTPKKC